MKNFKLNSKIVLIAVVILALGLAVSSFLSNQKNLNQPEKLIISQVPVQNFEANPVAQNESGDSLITQEANNDYQISYVEQYEQFYITINKSQFDQIRVIAEQEFLKKLDINQQQACQLKVIVSTPTFANPELAGQHFPLSFCQ